MKKQEKENCIVYKRQEKACEYCFILPKNIMTKYKLGSLIGSGASAAVYELIDIKTGTIFAAKFIPFFKEDKDSCIRFFEKDFKSELSEIKKMSTLNLGPKYITDFIIENCTVNNVKCSIGVYVSEKWTTTLHLFKLNTKLDENQILWINTLLIEEIRKFLRNKLLPRDLHSDNILVRIKNKLVQITFIDTRPVKITRKTLIDHFVNKEFGPITSLRLFNVLTQSQLESFIIANCLAQTNLIT